MSRLFAFALTCLIALAPSGGAHAADGKPGECKPDRMDATGSGKIKIDAATDSAYAALTAKIKKVHGPGWGLTSRRGAKYTCVKTLSGPRDEWECTLSAVPCARPK
jgi:hypothetical protein